MSFLRMFLLVVALFAITVPCSRAAQPAITDTGNGFHILCYHDIYIDATSADSADSLSVSVSELVKHFSWLRDNGYHVASVSELVASRNGGAPLPPRSVLLSFDDGYVSFHTHVLPLLKLFNYPATLAIVGGWIEAPANSNIEYESDRIDPARFMSWSQIRDAANSGLVEIASHTFNLHHGELANPQGNSQPAVTTRAFDRNNRQYETDPAYQARIESDLRRGVEIIRERTGTQPRIIVWPYGAYNATSSAIAKKLGMPIGFTLDNEMNTTTTNLAALNRVLVPKSNTLVDLVVDLQPRQANSERIITIDVSTLFSATPETFDRNLSRWLDRLLAIKPRAVILAAAEPPRQTGTPPGAWFANSVMPVNADVLNRAAWQIRTRTGAKVFVQLPGDSSLAPDTVTRFTRELGERVPLAGVVIEATGESDGSRIAKSMAALRDNQAKAESIYHYRWSGACSGADAKSQSQQLAMWRDALVQHDWVLLQVAPCNREQWQQFVAVARTIPNAMRKTIVEHAMDLSQSSAEPSRVATSLEFAHVAGFRHLAVAEVNAAPSLTDPQITEQLRRVISLETYPVKR
jgi:peptidoglycan/xylan/chitin deacetylase (PgdA/CDA1 family)